MEALRIGDNLVEMLDRWPIDLVMLMAGDRASHKQQRQTGFIGPEAEVYVVRAIAPKRFVEPAELREGPSVDGEGKRPE